jgi:hypothetical protein
MSTVPPFPTFDPAAMRLLPQSRTVPLQAPWSGWFLRHAVAVSTLTSPLQQQQLQTKQQSQHWQQLHQQQSYYQQELLRQQLGGVFLIRQVLFFLSFQVHLIMKTLLFDLTCLGLTGALLFVISGPSNYEDAAV